MDKRYVLIGFLAILAGAFFAAFGSITAGITVFVIFLILGFVFIIIFRLGSLAHKTAQISKSYLSDLGRGINQIRDYTTIASRTMPEDELKLLDSQEDTFQSLARDEKDKYKELEKVRVRLEEDKEVLVNLLSNKGEANVHVNALIKAIEQEEELVKQQAGILKEIHDGKRQLERVDIDEFKIDRQLEHSKKLSPNKINELMARHQKLDDERKQKQLKYTKSLEKLRSNAA